MTTYYALQCLQNGNLMYTGLNTTSKEELKRQLLSYISIDFNDDDEDWIKIQKLSVEDICEMWTFDILEMNERFEKE